MSDLKYCQGTKCHTYYTQDRLKGTKGNKTYQTRRRSRLYYGGGNFCDQRCMYDWFETFGNRSIDYFGRLTQAKHLTEQNAWFKDYDYEWSSGEITNYRFVNQVSKEQRPITKEQYNDSNYTLNER
jgi:hypothetical protein|tara:strand:+ start:92 stop:469 length:378 start_codon:yes stop_codon:yes gene_type:complete